MRYSVRLALVLVAVLGVSVVARGQEPPPVPAATSTGSDSAPVGDPIAELIKVREQFKTFKNDIQNTDDRHTKLLGLAALLATILRFLMAGLIRWGSFSSRLKDLTPGLLVLGGALVALLTKFAGGMNWTEALLLGGAGPLAVFVEEAFKMVKKEKGRRASQSPPSPPTAASSSSDSPPTSAQAVSDPPTSENGS